MHCETDSYRFEGYLFFHRLIYKSYEDYTSNYVSAQHNLGYCQIYHLNKGTKIIDYTGEGITFSRVKEYNPELTMYFPKTTVDNLMNVSDITTRLIPVNGTNIYY